ncbi:MAG: FtsX-like permease family protein [Oscillospiraceae bacterium]
MIKKLIFNDVKNNKLMSAASVFFMTASAMLLALAVMLSADLFGAVGKAAERANIPDLMQMHTGSIDEALIKEFAESRSEVKDLQICTFLNLNNSDITLGSRSLADSTQDNGISVQGERFDYLLGMDNELPDVREGQVYVPVCYRKMYDLSVGDIMKIGGSELVIAGFIRDAQMNSMLASSKRFLVNAADYEKIRPRGEEEYLIEFLLTSGSDVNKFSAEYASAGLPSNGPAITKPLIGMMNALSDGIMILIIFLVGIAVILISILCIRFILLLQTERDRTEICTLKALGIEKNDIKRIYFSKYLLFSACGGVLGLAAAFILRLPLGGEIRELYGTGNNGMISCLLSVLAAAVAEGVILLVVRKILKKTDNMPPVEAMVSAHNSEKSGRRGQYLLIGLVTAICTFIMLVPQNLNTTMSAPDFASYMGIGNGEMRMDIRMTEDIVGATERVASELERDKNVLKYSVLCTKTITAELSDNTAVNLSVETGDHTVFPVIYSKGRYPEKENEIALSSMNSKELGLDVGSELYLTLDGEKTKYTVCGIYSDITNGGETAKACGNIGGNEIVWSVVYVSLAENADKIGWVDNYRNLGADVTDIADYIGKTYGQTLDMVSFAAKVSAVTGAAVTAVVIMLFMRLIAEKKRSEISLQKALGIKSGDIKLSYFAKGIIPAVSGIAVGVFSANTLGEQLCGALLKLLGADSFRFVIDGGRVYFILPMIILITSAAAVLTGIYPIKNVRAYECCYGKE